MSCALGARSAETLRNTYMLGQRGLQALLESAGETGELNGGLSPRPSPWGRAEVTQSWGPQEPRGPRGPPLRGACYNDFQCFGAGADACACEGVVPATMISTVSAQAPMPARVKGWCLLQ